MIRDYCHHKNVTEHPKYAIDDPSGHYRCEDCGDTFPLIGDTNEWKPKEINYDWPTYEC